MYLGKSPSTTGLLIYIKVKLDNGPAFRKFT